MLNMQTSSSKDFKTGIDKEFSKMKLEPGNMQDAIKFKQSFKEEKLEGGEADNLTIDDLAMKHAYDDSTDSTSKKNIEKMKKHLETQLDMGIKSEMEHTKDKSKAKEIAMDHLSEDPNYYTKLKKIETKEQIIRRAIKQGITDNLIGTKEINLPIGKMTSMRKSNEVKENDKSAKKQFAKDLQVDKDYIEFKKNAKFKKGGAEFTFGVPNVTSEDPYIKKRKYSRPGKEETTEATGSGSSGAFSGPIAFKDSDFVRKSFAETPGMGKKLKEQDESIDKIEATEATGSGSVGGYSTPSMWAKSTSKKDWGPSRKTQYKGGSFVKVKKKCTKFPYCNQGDINALKLSKNESVKEAIKSVAQKLNLSENVIRTILEHEYEKMNKRTK